MNKRRRHRRTMVSGIVPVLAGMVCLVLGGCGTITDGFYRLRGDAYKSDGEPREAIRWYSRISSNNCTEAVLTRMMECYRQSEDYRGQLKTYRELYSRTGDSLYLESRLALAETREDHLERISSAKELLKHEPDNWAYRFSLVESMIYSSSSNDVPSTLANYEKVEVKTSTNQAVLGTLWYKYGNITNAIRFMGNAVTVSPSNDNLRQAYAVYLIEGEQYGLAVSNLQIVVERTPDDSSIRQIYGFALGELGRIGEAEGELRQSIYLNQHNATALNNLAYLLLMDNRGEKEALELALSAVQLERAGYTLDTLGYAYYRRGKYDIALRYLKEADQRMKEAQKTSDPEVAFHLGLVYAELGEMENAIARFRTAIQRDETLKKALSRERYYREIEKELKVVF